MRFDSLKRWLKRDAFVLLMFFIALLIMTYPLAFKLGEIIPLTNQDTYTAMWQNWWTRDALLTPGYDLNYTHKLFYPDGLDLTLMPRRWTTFPLWMALYQVFREPMSYNLLALIGIFVKAYAMYLLLLRMTDNRFASWVGGAFYAFAARSLSMALQQPNTGATEFIPIFMLCLLILLDIIRQGDASRRKTLFWLIVTILAYSANVYMNLKIGVFTALIGGVYLVWVMVWDKLWRSKRFWGTMIAFGVGCLILCAPILISTFSSDYVGSAITETDIETGVDLMAFIRADVFQPMFYNNYFAQFTGVPLTEFSHLGLTHLGLLNILLAMIGFGYALAKDRKQILWAILVLVFFLLSLGVTITYELKPLDLPFTPYSLLMDNVLFRALRSPSRFAMLMLFPMAILIAYGIHFVSSRVQRRNVLVWLGGVVLVVLMLFETSIFPISHRFAEIAPIFKDDSLNGAVIGIPMGRQEVKYQMYTQIWHDQPIHEGMIARLPDDAYDYVESNPVLRDWQTLDDITVTLDEWQQGIDALLADGFRYVVVHKYVDTGRDLFTTSPQRETFFSQAPTIFEDIATRVYDLATLKDYPPRILLEESD